jgi:8-oxo-dGTP pyrophosphatase MutT (NUDIX family)
MRPRPTCRQDAPGRAVDPPEVEGEKLGIMVLQGAARETREEAGLDIDESCIMADVYHGKGVR